MFNLILNISKKIAKIKEMIDFIVYHLYESGVANPRQLSHDLLHVSIYSN